MLAEAQRKADERGVRVEWVQGDMRNFDLDRTFEVPRPTTRPPK